MAIEVVNLLRGDSELETQCEWLPQTGGAQDAASAQFRLRVSFADVDRVIRTHATEFATTARLFLTRIYAPDRFAAALAQADAHFAKENAVAVSLWIEFIGWIACSSARRACREDTGFQLSAHIRVTIRRELRDAVVAIHGRVLFCGDGVVRLIGCEGIERVRLSGGSGDGECVICLNEVAAKGRKKKRVVRMRACSHVFHGPCLFRWFETGAQSCPVCRRAAVPPRSAAT